MLEFFIEMGVYISVFAVLGGVVTFVRKSMKQKNPKALEMSVDQLGVEWAVMQLAYAGPLLLSLVAIFTFLVAVPAFLFNTGILPIEVSLVILVFAFFLIVGLITWLAWPALMLTAKAGPNYIAMRKTYAKNHKSYLEEALKDKRVLASQKFLGKFLSKLIYKIASSKVMKY